MCSEAKASVIRFFLVGYVTCSIAAPGKLFLSFPVLNHYCIPPRGDECVPIYSCPFFASLLRNSPVPRPSYVTSLVGDYQCGFDGNLPEVCCFRDTMITQQTSQVSGLMPQATESTRRTTEDIKELIATTITPSDTSTITPITEFIVAQESNSHLLSAHSIVDRSNDDLTNHKNYKLLPHDICGPIYDGFKITNGQSAALGEFPWMALIIYNADDSLDFKCGGTVIHKNYILTAAHCILNASIHGVRLGESDISKTNDCDESYCLPPVQDFFINKTIVHPDYDKYKKQNDIALIRIEESANFTYENAQPVCLPFQNHNLEGKHVVVSGWGITESGFRSAELKKASIPIVGIEECMEFYKDVTDNEICAGGELERDSCDGDSGGPLVLSTRIKGTLKSVQYGIVSYGTRKCGAKNRPAVYTRVSSYLEWILDNIDP